MDDIHEAVDADGDILEPIVDFDLSTRAFNCLCDDGITDAEQVRWMTDDELLNLRNLGKGTFAELREVFGPYTGPPSIRDPLREAPLRYLPDRHKSALRCIQHVQGALDAMQRYVETWEAVRRGIGDYSDEELITELRRRGIL